MTSVEKQLNKQDLEAYKNKETAYNSLIPGLNNTLNLKPSGLWDLASSRLDKKMQPS